MLGHKDLEIIKHDAKTLNRKVNNDIELLRNELTQNSIALKML